MFVTQLSDSQAVDAPLSNLTGAPPAWILSYGVADAPLQQVQRALRRRYPSTPVFGTTSFRGVFTNRGFTRDIALLVAEEHDRMDVGISLRSTGASHATSQALAAAREVTEQLGGRPSMLLLHATPGFEERILEGIRKELGTDVPVYGGSAADDDISGNWKVLSNGTAYGEGFLLVGIRSPNQPRGAFVSGYLPTEHKGKITAADGRIVHTIDHKPAALVYDAWTNGAIRNELKAGGSVLVKTNLLPVARTVGEGLGMPRRLLSHPNEVLPNGRSLSFFAEFQVGEEITLMTGTRDPLVARVRRTVQRAQASGRERVRGGLLVYCGGCLSALLDQADRIAGEFENELGDAPFVGVATFGEQGTFFEKTESRHGNLMCSTVLF